MSVNSIYQYDEIISKGVFCMAKDSLGMAIFKVVVTGVAAALGPQARAKSNPGDFKGNWQAHKNEMRNLVDAGKNLHSTIKNR